MIRWFRNVLRALQAISGALGGVADAVHGLRTEATEDPKLAARVADLERELERRYAEAEGLLLRAEGKHKAARAAEERARRLSESAQGDEDGDDADDLFAAYAAAAADHVRNGDEETGPAEGLHPVRGGMGSRRETREALRRAKFGY